MKAASSFKIGIVIPHVLKGKERMFILRGNVPSSDHSYETVVHPISNIFFFIEVGKNTHAKRGSRGAARAAKSLRWGV